MCGAGGEGGGNFLYIYVIVRMCVPNGPLSAASYMIGPLFFSTKSICMTRFFRIPM